MAEPPGPVLVVIPTYQERENIGPVIARLHAAVPAADVLVVDDASPDGTGEVADEMAAADPRVRVLHREGKNGLGAAYLAGFRHALSGEHQVVVEMDADGSHSPEDLPALLAALDEGPGADLVLGSRYTPGGRVQDWPMHREWLSRGANVYSRLALGVPIRDITGGYRAYRRQVLEALDLDTISSQGYCFQVDMAWRAVKAGFRVREVPITFTDRELGSSKMSGAVVAEALLRVTGWGISHRLRRSRGAAPGATAPSGTAVSGTAVSGTVVSGSALSGTALSGTAPSDAVPTDVAPGTERPTTAGPSTEDSLKA
ncbi:polyprenol monophosphomannose synthase [Pseudonocardia ailaonensis]|uniref:Polyprenol monophosphomannose synthase n=1 Tax=Pseudonocardia ailaonensis TaxID=367279 RepID=A0ABN2MMW8_9PSEU